MLIKSFVISLIISLFLSLFVQADDFRDGYAAFEKGDYKTAINLMKPLAEQGHVKAQYNLGFMYEYGYGVPVNDTQAVKWYLLAAEQGDVIAQYNLNAMYSYGRDAPENYKQAVKWYQLAVMYENGNGVLINYTEAVRLYNLSASQGNELGMYNLAQMYSEGKGIEEDKVYAYMWFNLAGGAGHSSAKKEREELSEKMTTKELRIAQELSQKCLDSNYKKCESALPNFLHRKLNLSSKDND